MNRWQWPFFSPRVFVSYAHEDANVVEQEIVGLLRALPVGHWVDRHGVKPGEVLSHAIARAIRRSNRVLIVVSKSSAVSKWVRLEVQYACQQKKRVVPILLDDTPKESVDECLAGRLHLDFRRDNPVGLKIGLERLNSEIKQEAHRHAASWMSWIASWLLIFLSIHSLMRTERVGDSEDPAMALAALQQSSSVEEAMLKEVDANIEMGTVYWSAERNEGFVRIAGLKINDPAVSQYQIWAQDSERANPVDLGVFDMTSSSEVIIPLNPKLDVGEVTLVFVTAEQPGGVVVSKRELMVCVAAFE